MTGDLAGAVAQLREVIAEADAAHDVFWRCYGLFMQALMLAYHGDPSAARDAANAAVEAAPELWRVLPGPRLCGVGRRDPRRGRRCRGGRCDRGGLATTSVSSPSMAAIWIAYVAQAALARGDLTAARRWADEAVAATSGFHLSLALTTRARRCDRPG